MRWIAAALVVAGCLNTSTTRCPATGAECPEGYSCISAEPYCAPSGEVAACAGRGDQAACTTATVADGVCIASRCTPCAPDLEGCSVVGWQAMTSGTTEDLRGVWVAGPGNAFAVGLSGTLLHYDGSSWQAIAAPTTESLQAIWGNAPDDIYALADAEVFHFTTAWAGTGLTSSGGMLDVWGTGVGSDVFAVGASNQIWRYASGAWTPLTQTLTSAFARFSGVAGTGPSELWVVGKDGAVPVFLHYDGATSWAKAPALAAPYDDMAPSAVWSISSSDVFAVGTAAGAGVVVRLDGAMWTPSTVATAGLDCVWGTDRNNVYAAGPGSGGDVILHFDGSAWSGEAVATGVPRLWRISGDTYDVFAVGDKGTILRHTAH
jgi:hypothetical protein